MKQVRWYVDRRTESDDELNVSMPEGRKLKYVDFTVCGGECRNGMTPKESSSPSNGTNPTKENIDSLTSIGYSPVVQWGMQVAQVVCFVRRKSPTAAVARKTYSNNLGEESHVDNN